MRTNLNWSRNLHWKFFRPWKITICPHFALFTFYQIEALRYVVTNFTLILALLSNSLALNEKYQLRRQIFVVIQFLCKIFIFKNCSFQKPCRQVLIFSLSTYIDQKWKKNQCNFCDPWRLWNLFIKIRRPDEKFTGMAGVCWFGALLQTHQVWLLEFHMSLTPMW